MTTVITGATTGVGLPLAAALARAGHRLVLGVRDPGRGDRAVAAIRAAAPGAAVEHRPLDLGSLRSVRAFAGALPADVVDRLVLNAGVMSARRAETEDGFERMLGTNALGHFALTGLLVDRLRAARAPRIVTQSSESHRRGRLERADLQHERDFRAVQAYHDSKYAQHVLAVELARRLPDVESVVAQPGWVRSELGREVLAGGAPLWQRALLRVGDRLVGQSPEDGARAALRATLDRDMPSARTGRYMTPAGFQRLRGAPALDDADPRVLDPEDGEALWRAAVALTGIDPATPATAAAA